MYQKVLGAAERAGAQVVCFENCAGIKPARCCVDAGAKDILSAIADAYLTIGCAVMTPNRRRFDMIRALIEEFHADAVLDIALSSCHTYLIEGRSLRELCHSLGVPYMALIANAYLGKGLTFWQVIKNGMLIYLPGDLLKIALGSFLCVAITRRLPQVFAAA